MSVYFLEFDTPLGNLNNKRAQAKFYIGWTDDVDARLAEHRAGRGAKITAAAVERGIGFKVVLVIDGDRSVERAIKNKKNTRKFLEKYFRTQQ